MTTDTDLEALKEYLRVNYSIPDTQIFSVWLSAIEALQRELAESHELYYKRSEDYARTERERDACHAELKAISDALGTNEGHSSVAHIQALQSENAALRAEVERLQAQIDRLMLEYCPSEMTQAQKENWGEHQKAVP